MPAKRKASDKQIIEAYEELGNVWKVGERFGMCGQSVHERLQKLGVDTSERAWSEEDIALLSRFYTERIFVPKDEFGLDDLAALLGRHKANVSRKARSLGLTDMHRRLSADQKARMANGRDAHFAEHGHPRGMLGKKHSEEMRKAMAERVKGMWAGDCSAFVSGNATLKSLQTKHGKGILYLNRTKCSWKAGKRLVGDREIHFRSSWEANYARYLQLLQDCGAIHKWEFEVDTFWFDKVPRGTRSYLPDFKVWLDDASFYYVEVKGWMDDKSATKLKRMAEYYPEILVYVLKREDMLRIEDTFGESLPFWEFIRSPKSSGGRKGRKVYGGGPIFVAGPSVEDSLLDELS